MATGLQQRISADVRTDHRKLDSTGNFEKSLESDTVGGGFGPGGGPRMGLKNFADQRRTYLLEVTPPGER